MKSMTLESQVDELVAAGSKGECSPQAATPAAAAVGAVVGAVGAAAQAYMAQRGKGGSRHPDRGNLPNGLPSELRDENVDTLVLVLSREK